MALLLAVVTVDAASVKFQSTWRNPKAKVIDISGKKLAAFVVTADESLRLGPEETLAADLRRRGIDCVAGYTVLPGELAKDQAKAKEFPQKNGITGAILMRVLVEDQVRNVPPSVYYSTGYSPSFWGYWNYGWSAVYTPGYARQDRIVSIETLGYAIDEDELLWTGTSQTRNPKDDVRKFVRQLLDEIGKEMRKSGLVRE